MPLFPSTSGLALQAATPVAGTALVNGTPTILTWTTPNDGKLHRFTYFGAMTVATQETGGNVNVNFTAPDGTSQGFTFFPGGQNTGQNFSQTIIGFVCKANTAVTVQQTSALTGGAATLWAEIWGS